MNKIISVKNRIENSINNRLITLQTGMKQFGRDQKGEGYLDMAMKILIVVVVGAAILAIMNTAMPTLFQNLINKVSEELTSIDVLPTT